MKIKLEFDYWSALDSFIMEKYPDVVCFLHDSNLSFFDKDEVPIGPDFYIFDDINKFTNWIENTPYSECGVNIISDLSILWINGKQNSDVIYDLRG